jgi:hypothetical protein
MKEKITTFVNTKRDLAVASGKAYAVAKGKETAYRSINSIMETPQFKKIDDLGVEKIDQLLGFALVKLEKVESFNTKTNTKVMSIIDKTIKALMITGITVASLGIIGGTAASFLTANFFWMILTALSVVALGGVIAAGVGNFTAEENTAVVAVVEPLNQEAEVPVLTAVVAGIEDKLSAIHLPELKVPELKAA